MFHRLGDRRQQVFVGHRFQQIVDAGQTHGFGNIFEFGIGGQKDADCIQPVLTDMVQKFQPAAAGHFNIQDHNGDGIGGKDFQSLLHVIGTEDFCKNRAIFGNFPAGAFCTVIFIIYNQ